MVRVEVQARLRTPEVQAELAERAERIIAGLIRRTRVRAQELVHVDTGYLQAHIREVVTGPLQGGVEAAADYAFPVELRYPYLLPAALDALAELPARAAEEQL